MTIQEKTTVFTERFVETVVFFNEKMICVCRQMEIAEVIVRMGWVTFLLICILTDGKIITDNILYILNVIM